MNHSTYDDDCINLGYYRWGPYLESYFDVDEKILSIKLEQNITEYSKWVSRLMFNMISFDGRFNISYVFFNQSNLRSLREQNKIDYWEAPGPLSGDMMYLYEHSPRMVMSTAYDCSLEKSLAEQRQKDFGECILAFDSETWLTTCIFFSIISLLISIHIKLNRCSTSGSWITFRHIVNQVNFVDFNWQSRVSGILSDLFVFLVVICYFGNMITSDKVTTYVPDVYKHYTHIPTNRNVTVYFLNIWRSSPVHNDTRNKLLDYFKHSNVRFDDVSGAQLGNKILGKLGDRETRIFVGYNVNIKQLRCQGCYGLHSNDVCLYVGRDSLDNSDVSASYDMSESFRKKKIFPKYFKFFKRSMETGLRQYQRNWLFPTDCSDQVNRDTQNCFSESVVLHDPELSPFDLSNYQYCLSALAIPFTLAVIRLTQELCSGKKTVTEVRPFSAPLTHGITKELE